MNNLLFSIRSIRYAILHIVSTLCFFLLFFSCERKITPTSDKAVLSSITLTVGDIDYSGSVSGTHISFNVAFPGGSIPKAATVKAIAISDKSKSSVAEGETLSFTDAQKAGLTITAENGTTTQDYTISIANTVAELTSLTVTIAGKDYVAAIKDRTASIADNFDLALISIVVVKSITLSLGATSSHLKGVSLAIVNGSGMISVTSESQTNTQAYTLRLDK